MRIKIACLPRKSIIRQSTKKWVRIEFKTFNLFIFHQTISFRSLYSAEVLSRTPPNVSEADIKGLLQMEYRSEDILEEPHMNEGYIGKTIAVPVGSLKFPSK